MDPWATNHEKLENVFQEGILDRIKSRVGKVKTGINNVKSGFTDGVMQNPTATQVNQYMDKKYAEIVNDIGKLVKDSPQKVEMGDLYGSGLKDAFDQFNKRVYEIYTGAQQAADPQQQQPQQQNTAQPPPLPQQQSYQARTGNVAPATMGSR